MVYYLTYDEYQEMGGTLDETLFNTLLLDAQGYIDWYTFNRLWKEEWRTEEVMERVKICVYQLIGLVAAKSNLITPQVQSTGGINVNAQVSQQSNDGVSTAPRYMQGVQKPEDPGRNGCKPAQGGAFAANRRAA